jgi:glycosyltransferase involved in cell wall biosynthesis
MADRFDILHFHTEFLHFPMFEDLAARTVTTCHSRMDHVGLPGFFRRYRGFPLVSISDAQRRPLPDAAWVATVPHGYPLDLFRQHPGAKGGGDGGYLAFLGRIAPDKGIDTAIEIARRAGLRLKIAARINSFDRPYWEQAIEPQVDGHQIEYVGEIRDGQKNDFLNGARALVFPIRWPEPFGLVMIEAMACGTPVIATPCGSVPEVVEDGVTGRIVSTVEEAVDAAGDIGRLDRDAIRRRFEERFSSERMANAYLEIYRGLRKSAPPSVRRTPRRRRPGIGPGQNGFPVVPHGGGPGGPGGPGGRWAGTLENGRD